MKKQIYPLDEKKALEYYNMGLEDQIIADNLGVCNKTVRNWRKRIGLSANKPEGKKRPAANLSPIARDNEAARAAGMTYGQYKARLYAAAQPRKGGRK